jgi:MFS family permease
MVDLPLLGRRGTLAISTCSSQLMFTKKKLISFSHMLLYTVLTGAFILASTTARTSNAILGWNCAYSFTSNVMYGVLYAITPELFPTKDRGTGSAIVAAANRVFGIMVSIQDLLAYLYFGNDIILCILGSYYRLVRQPEHARTNLHFRCALPCLRLHRALVAVRAARACQFVIDVIPHRVIASTIVPTYNSENKTKQDPSCSSTKILSLGCIVVIQSQGYPEIQPGSNPS